MDKEFPTYGNLLTHHLLFKRVSLKRSEIVPVRDSRRLIRINHLLIVGKHSENRQELHKFSECSATKGNEPQY